MGFHGYYFNIKSGYITNKYPHCYVGIKRIGAKWGLYNRVSSHDYKWGLYNRVSDKSCCWGDYGGDDMTITMTENDYSLTKSGKFIVENNWHKISGTPFSEQTKLYDANGRPMNGNNYVIDIYFKLIACKDDKTLFWKQYIDNISPIWYYYYSSLEEFMNECDCAATMFGQYNGSLCLAVNSTQDGLFSLPNFEDINDLPQGTPISGSIIDRGFYWTPNFNPINNTREAAFLNTHDNSNTSGITSMQAMLKGIGHNGDNITYNISTSVQDIGVPFTDNNNNNKYLLPELRQGFIMMDNCASNHYSAKQDYNYFPELAALYMCLDCHRV